MFRFLFFILTLVLVTACTPTASHSVVSGTYQSVNSGTTTPDPGADLISRIRQFPGTTVVNRGAHSIIKSSKNDGINNAAEISPTFVLNGKVCDGGFFRVYNDVVAANGLSSVRFLRESHEIARYGIVGSNVVISVETAK